jgi:hypothetical protein
VRAAQSANAYLAEHFNSQLTLGAMLNMIAIHKRGSIRPLRLPNRIIAPNVPKATIGNASRSGLTILLPTRRFHPHRLSSANTQRSTDAPLLVT